MTTAATIPATAEFIERVERTWRNRRLVERVPGPLGCGTPVVELITRHVCVTAKITGECIDHLVVPDPVHYTLWLRTSTGGERAPRRALHLDADP
jgi:hypothetical protein